MYNELSFSLLNGTCEKYMRRAYLVNHIIYGKLFTKAISFSIFSIPSPDKSADLLLAVLGEDTLVSMKSTHYIQGVGGIS